MMDIYNNSIILIPCILFIGKEKEKKKKKTIWKIETMIKKKLKPEKFNW